jgi:hypothetical protein
VENVHQDGEVAISSELVCNELGVDEAMPNNIWQDDDGVIGRLGGWVGEVCLSCLVMNEYALQLGIGSDQSYYPRSV